MTDIADPERSGGATELGLLQPVQDCAPSPAAALRRAARAARARGARPATAEASPPGPPDAYRQWGKRCLDVALVLLSLPVALPLILLCAALLACERKGILYRQTRLGRHGRRFRMIKLRTMVPGADALLELHLARDPALRAEWNRTQKLRHDPRITPVGRFLRRTSLDELPQLWHVLTGEMSLVGPRPMIPHQAELYGDIGPYVAMRPGLTGLWQVMERNEGDFASRARADRAYARDCSLGVDLRLILLTCSAVVRGTGH